MFLPVPAHPGSPGQRAVKRLLLLLCLSAHIFERPHVQTLQNSLYMLLAVAQSSGDEATVCYILPFCRCLPIMGHMARN